LATTKETFGIGILEAMASGVPVLGFRHGGILDLVEHGVSGYLAEPNDYEDLERGLRYCLENREILGDNGRELSREWTWEKAVEKVADLYRDTLREISEPATVSVVIPTYNYADKVERAIKSAINQTLKPTTIVVVDDGSTDDTESVVKRIIQERKEPQIKYIRQNNSGVAVARNRGISETSGKYVCCLDADDAIKPEFLQVCVDALEEDRSLGIAYTGLEYIKPDGETGKSPWPDEFDYDAQLNRKNQIPTCCVFRKEMWERLGGYNQKYAPTGAGSEDAEFWLRAGAYGWDAKLVTAGPLFVYSWMSGRVSGDENYREVDWLAAHPWVEDRKHPFASLATPKNNISHPVRQYDSPIASVIIPVGKGHHRQFIDALDSLESQTFRYWEAIVVLDGAEFDESSEMKYVPESLEAIKRAYPYVNFITTSDNGDPVGAGAARNLGVKHSRGKLLLFLDADDWLYPHAMKTMIDAWNDHGYIVYSDYVGKAQMSREEANKLQGRLLHYDENKNEAVIKHYSADFECERAIAQPLDDGRNTYIWCLVTSLVPRMWHEQIGGFDENMDSWEDWDYWIRMARYGRCFWRVQEDLVVYRFYTGARRETGLHQHRNLLEYLLEKKRKDAAATMSCNCPGTKRVTVPSPQLQRVALEQVENTMQDNEMVLVLYDSRNVGQHKVIGPATHVFYGYRSGGEKFYVNRRDLQAAPHIFKQIQEAVRPPEQTQPPISVVEKPQPLEDAGESPIDFQTIGGITDQIADALKARGITTEEDILRLGVDGLQEVKGIGKVRAEAIIASVTPQE
jgi:glycosyltransferase involved in cell wall biosynthesis